MDGILCTNGVRIGVIRKYNPKRNEGYVIMDGVGTEEWGAMDSAYYVEVDGKRIPNKWDGKVDPHKAFFGDEF